MKPVKSSIQMPLLDLRQLHYFIAVAEHKSITGAAEALRLAQPSLSENIAKLERKLNVQLVTREQRGVTLTDAGKLLAQRGRNLLHSAQKLADAIQSFDAEASGFFSLAMPPSLGLILAVPLAETVHMEIPTIHLQITEAMSRTILERLEREELHLGCSFDLPDPGIFASTPLFTEEMFLITAPDNWPGAIGRDGKALKSISIEELAGLPLVLPRNSHGARTIIEQSANKDSVTLNIVMEIDALPHLVEMAQRASAYTILPEAAVYEHVQAGRLALVRIENSKIERTAYLVHKRSRTPSRASIEIQNCLRTILREVIDRYGFSARCY